jgi:8-oxo-dGTP pyrophosphatase MutT (NUDIX family)
MPRVHQQAAVIPYRIRKDRIEVALVTTSRGKGWIVPKGSVDDGERPRDAAIREAEEEAGVRGASRGSRSAAISARTPMAAAAWTYI